MTVSRAARSRGSAQGSRRRSKRSERTPKVNDIVDIWWAEDKTYYRGRLLRRHGSDSKFRIEYDDGETEDLNLHNEDWKFAHDEPHSPLSEDDHIVDVTIDGDYQSKPLPKSTKKPKLKLAKSTVAKQKTLKLPLEKPPSPSTQQPFRTQQATSEKTETLQNPEPKDQHRPAVLDKLSPVTKPKAKQKKAKKAGTAEKQSSNSQYRHNDVEPLTKLAHVEPNAYQRTSSNEMTDVIDAKDLQGDKQKSDETRDKRVHPPGTVQTSDTAGAQNPDVHAVTPTVATTVAMPSQIDSQCATGSKPPRRTNVVPTVSLKASGKPLLHALPTLSTPHDVGSSNADGRGQAGSRMHQQNADIPSGEDPNPQPTSGGERMFIGNDPEHAGTNGRHIARKSDEKKHKKKRRIVGTKNNSASEVLAVAGPSNESEMDVPTAHATTEVADVEGRRSKKPIPLRMNLKPPSAGWRRETDDVQVSASQADLRPQKGIQKSHGGPEAASSLPATSKRVSNETDLSNPDIDAGGLRSPLSVRETERHGASKKRSRVTTDRPATAMGIPSTGESHAKRARDGNVGDDSTGGGITDDRVGSVTHIPEQNATFTTMVNRRLNPIERHLRALSENVQQLSASLGTQTTDALDMESVRQWHVEILDEVRAVKEDLRKAESSREAMHLELLRAVQSIQQAKAANTNSDIVRNALEVQGEPQSLANGRSGAAASGRRTVSKNARGIPEVDSQSVPQGHRQGREGRNDASDTDGPIAIPDANVKTTKDKVVAASKTGVIAADAVAEPENVVMRDASDDVSTPVPSNLGASVALHEKVLNLVARQVTVWLLETPHEHEQGKGIPLVQWAKSTSAGAFERVSERLSQFDTYTQAYQTLSTSLGNDAVELSWFTEPKNPSNVLQARRNYAAWDPPPSDDEWKSEVVLLKELAAGFHRSLRSSTTGDEDHLRAAVAVTKSAAASYGAVALRPSAHLPPNGYGNHQGHVPSGPENQFNPQQTASLGARKGR